MEAASWARLKSADSHFSYSKRTLCTMRWSLDVPLAKCMSAVMPAGGPIALLGGDGTMPGTRMQLFSGGGELLSAWEWDYGRVRALGWTPAAELVCVLESGRVMYWSLHGARIADFALGDAIEREAVLQCEPFSDGLVILTAAFRLFALLSFAKRVVVPLADPRLASPPTAMCVLERSEVVTSAPAPSAAGTAATAATADALPPGVPRCPQVLLGTASRTILLIDEYEAHDQLLASGPFVCLAPSPNCKFIACFSASGALLVISSDFSRHLSELATHSARPPRQLVWCGADSILLPWDRLLLMVGPYGDSVKYEYEKPPLLKAEVDGVRILTDEASELLQRVPDATEALFQPGSLAPAARLLEASRAFEQGDIRCDELLKSLGYVPLGSGGSGGGPSATGSDSELAAAVVGCIHAARHEPSIETQTVLLNAAVFGKAYVPLGVDKDLLALTCATLRVLNALREPKVGMPITWTQYETTGAPALLQRLVARREHVLAWNIAAFLCLPKMQSSIALQWSCHIIQEAPAALPDASLLDKLRESLTMGTTASSRPRVSEVAAEAHRVGRQHLAMLLLDEFEPSAAHQVPLLLTMNELPTALARAISSDDSELIHLVLLHAKATLPGTEFFELLLPQPIAQRLFAAYCRAREPELLKTLYYQANLPVEAAALAIREAYRAVTWAQRMRGLSIALQFYEHSAQPQCAALARATEEQLKLLDAQRQLEHNTKGRPPPPGMPPAIAERFRFVDTSLNETIYRAFAYGFGATADRLRAELKSGPNPIPERRWWRLKLKGLSHARDWGAMWELANSGSAIGGVMGKAKSPIGFKPFAEACIEQGGFDEAARYLPRLPPAESVPLWLKIGRVDDARKVAMQHKEKQPELLKMVVDVQLGVGTGSSSTKG